jgi:hypothetical protein
MYGGAALVGLSRMYNNRHWASDVITGAAIGTFAGTKVVRYHHTASRQSDRSMALGRVDVDIRPRPDLALARPIAAVTLSHRTVEPLTISVL